MWQNVERLKWYGHFCRPLREDKLCNTTRQSQSTVQWPQSDSESTANTHRCLQPGTERAKHRAHDLASATVVEPDIDPFYLFLPLGNILQLLWFLFWCFTAPDSYSDNITLSYITYIKYQIVYCISKITQLFYHKILNILWLMIFILLCSTIVIIAPTNTVLVLLMFSSLQWSLMFSGAPVSASASKVAAPLS